MRCLLLLLLFFWGGLQGYLVCLLDSMLVKSLRQFLSTLETYIGECRIELVQFITQ